MERSARYDKLEKHLLKINVHTVMDERISLHGAACIALGL